jgi:hypothetical protein
MPGWLTDLVAKQCGFAVPLMYAAATYGVFRWLDKKASGPAKSSISSWLQSIPTTNDDLGNAVLEMFNRIYTPRLLSFRAFARSAIFTILISCVFLFEASPQAHVIRTVRESYDALITTLFANVLSDYVSLFVVKFTLAHGKSAPITASIRGVTAGMSVVAGFAVVQNMIVAILEMIHVPWFSFINQTVFNIMATFNEPFWLALFLASLVVHLWLPLFLLSAWTLRGMEYLKLTIGLVQWFIKQGRHHPFEAVGYVASVIVFVSGAIVQYVWR